MRCTLCKDWLDADSPYSVYTRNPLTWRHGWMHGLCFQHALELLKGDCSSDPQYKNRYDEYIQLEDK